MGLAENKEVVRQFVETFPACTARALANDDPGELATQLTDDFFWVVPDSFPRAGTHGGRLDVLQFLREGSTLFEPGTLHNEILGMVAEDDYVAVRIECTGTSAKGRPYRSMYHVLFRVRDDKISELWDYFDTLHSYQSLYA